MESRQRGLVACRSPVRCSFIFFCSRSKRQLLRGTERQNSLCHFYLARCDVLHIFNHHHDFRNFLANLEKITLVTFRRAQPEHRIARYSIHLRCLVLLALSWIPLIVFVPLNLIFRFKSPYVGQIKSLLLSITNLNYAVNPFAHMSIIKAALRARARPTKEKTDSPNERPRAVGTEEQAAHVEENLDAELQANRDPSTTGAGQMGPPAELVTSRRESSAKSRPGAVATEEQAGHVDEKLDAKLQANRDPSSTGTGQVGPPAELVTSRRESSAKSRPGTARTEEQAGHVEENLDAEPKANRDPSTTGTGQVGPPAELVTSRRESSAKSRPGTARTEEQVGHMEENLDAKLQANRDPSTTGAGQVGPPAELVTSRRESSAKSRPGTARTEEQVGHMEENLDAKLQANGDPSTTGAGQVGPPAELVTSRRESSAKSRPGAVATEEQTDEVEENLDAEPQADEAGENLIRH